MKKKSYYTPSDIANACGIHSNTVRLYEKSGFVTLAKRDNNNYRMYTELHLLQFKLCRAIFDYPFTNSKIRAAGCYLLRTNAECDAVKTNLAYDRYMKAIQKEINLANEAIYTTKCWIKGGKSNSDKIISMSRKGLAAMLGITTESIRNWERNGLIYADSVGSNNEILYVGINVERTKIIYLLRQAGYSMSALYKCFFYSDKGDLQKAIDSLEETNYDEIFSAGDRWMSTLLQLREGAERILPILEQIKEIK